MTHEELSKKRLWFVAIFAYFLLGYFLCNYFNMHRNHYFDLCLPFETRIPFIPAFILGYTGVYLAVVAIYAAIDDYKLYKQVTTFFLIVSTVHFIFFLTIPVKMARPDLSNASGIMHILTQYYYVIDNPTNCFPSLHVSYPLAGTLILWNYKRNWGYILGASTIIVAISVLLVKQHYIMDVIGAVVVTGTIYAVMKLRQLL